MKSIASALVKAQKAFGPAIKSSKNPHFKNTYAPLDVCLEAVMDSLNDAGIFLMQATHDDKDGVVIETTFVHESGETLSAGRLFVPAAKQDPQGYGSALTYARRYSLMAACGIAGEDDDGNAASRPQVKQPARGDIHAAIGLVANAKDLDSLNAAWKSEVVKFDPKGDEYKRLKEAAGARKQFLTEMMAGVEQ